MSVQLNHTIIAARDKRVSAEFLATILGLQVGPLYDPFLPVETNNGVVLYFADSSSDIKPQHYAFLVSDAEFDAIFERIKQTGVPYFADPGHHRSGQINHNDGGRGLYFPDPDGHNLEIITRPYGSG